MKVSRIALLISMISVNLIADENCLALTYKAKDCVVRPNKIDDLTLPKNAPCYCNCRGTRTSYGKCLDCDHVRRPNGKKFAQLWLNLKKAFLS